MKVWNKETRNGSGEFYRNGDWGVEVADDFLTTSPRAANFTSVEPPDDKCDWNETTGSWDLATDFTDAEIEQKRKKRYNAELPDDDQMDELWKAIEALATATATTLPATAQAIIDARNQIKSDLPKNP